MAANGRLADSDLATVQGSQRLAWTAARAFLNWSAAARTAGRRIAIPTDGAYRTYDRQAYMFTHPERYPGKNLAYPGTSPHGLGTCVDIIGDLDWAITTAAAYGFTRPIKGDLNHFQHNGLTTGPAPAPAATPTPAPAVPTRPKEHHMAPVIQAKTSGAIVQLFEKAEPYAFSYPELSIALAAAKAYNGTQELIVMTNEEVTVLIAQNVNRARANQATPPVDVDALAAALAPLLTDDEDTDDAPAIAAAVQAALAPDFAAIPGAVIDEQKKPGN